MENKSRREFVDSEELDKSIYSQALQKWDGMESLVDHTCHLNIPAHLLAATRCDRLTSL